MKKIGLIVPYHYTLFSMGAILDVIGTVNRMLSSFSKSERFDVTVFNLPEQIHDNGNEFHGYPVRSIRSSVTVDIIFVPGLATARIKEVIDENSKYIPWLQKQFEAGAEVASFCTGAFLFAASGLLNGRQATTHVD